jgi:phage tail sheath gpL-like
VLYVATDGNPATPATDAVEALKALGESFNSENVVLFPCPADSDGPVWAAALAGTVSLSAGIDPARPFQTLTVGGLRAANGFSRAERESLLRSGVSTWTRSLSGDVVIERLITTYRKNAAGADDEAYLDLTTVLTLSYLRYSFRTYFMTKYPRHKLADDGVIVEPGQPVMTPKLARAEAISWYREMERLALVEGGDRFKDALVVERDARDRNRLNFLLPPDLINGFLVGAAKLAFTT